MKTSNSSPRPSRGPWPAALTACALALAGSTSAMPGDPAPGQRASQAHSAEQVVREWPAASRKAADAMIQEYGEPDAVTEDMLVWRDNGPWVRTIVHREPVQHDFPLPHEDVLEQVIAYEVPEEMFSELARFDGSVVAARTVGELAVRCDREAANFLALNLAHDIIEGERSVEEARSFYADTIRQLMQGEQPQYTRELQFETRTLAATRDPGEQVISPQVAAAEGGPSGASAAAEAAQGGSVAATILTAELAGKSVLTSDGESVGEVAEIRTDEQGRHMAVIEPDAFLGLGQEELTLPLSELTLTSDGALQTSMSRDELEARQESGESEHRGEGEHRTGESEHRGEGEHRTGESEYRGESEQRGESEHRGQSEDRAM